MGAAVNTFYTCTTYIIDAITLLQLNASNEIFSLGRPYAFIKVAHLKGNRCTSKYLEYISSSIPTLLYKLPCPWNVNSTNYAYKEV